MSENDTLLKFPTDFPIKIMGEKREGFARAMIEIVQRHAPDFKAETLKRRTSRSGKYLSLTCTIRAMSKTQLDDIYREITAHPWVSMAL